VLRIIHHILSGVICVIFAVGIVRAVFTFFGTALIAVLFNDSGAPFIYILGLAIRPLLVVAIIGCVVVYIWFFTRWRYFALPLIIPVALLDFEPAGTLHKWFSAADLSSVW
jgi:hypothetical protein